MRYMMFIKHVEDYRNADVPASLYEEMGTFIEEATKSGNFVAGAGLQPSSAGARVRLKSGKITVTDGHHPDVLASLRAEAFGKGIDRLGDEVDVRWARKQAAAAERTHNAPRSHRNARPSADSGRRSCGRGSWHRWSARTPGDRRSPLEPAVPSANRDCHRVEPRSRPRSSQYSR